MFSNKFKRSLSNNRELVWLAVAALLAGAILIFMAYQPAREGYNRVDDPQAFFTEDNWVEFQSDSGHFRLEFPAEPETQQFQETTPEGPVEATQYVAESAGEEFVAQHHVYPESADTSDVRAVLASALSGGLEEIPDMQLRDGEFTQISGHPAFRFEALSRQQAVEATGVYIFDGQRLYVVLVFSDDLSENTAGRFIDSFQFMSNDS